MDQSSEDAEYERALEALSGLISGRQRKDSGMWSHAFEMMQSYLEASGPAVTCSGRSLAVCVLPGGLSRPPGCSDEYNKVIGDRVKCLPCRPAPHCLPTTAATAAAAAAHCLLTAIVSQLSTALARLDCSGWDWTKSCQS